MVETLIREAERLGTQLIELIGSLSALHSLSKVESRSVDEATLVRSALKCLMQNQDMERCSFFVLNNDELFNATSVSWDDLDDDGQFHIKQVSPSASTQRFKVGEGIIGEAARSQSIQHCSDCRSDPRFQVKSGQGGRFIPGSLISAPVSNGHELLGVLNISHSQAHYFSVMHIRLLHIFCNVLGQLIMNCRLYQKFEEQIAERTKQLGDALEEAKLLKDRFEALSLTDALTGLFNRRYFFSQAEKVLSAAKRYGQPISTFIIDLDHFKRVNDTYGHANGDRVLCMIAKALADEIRECDILARMGGEEFAIIAPNTDYPQSVRFAERIRTKIAKMQWEFAGCSVGITASIGLSYVADAGEARTSVIDELLRHADDALYEAKKIGRDRVVTYSQPNSA